MCVCNAFYIGKTIRELSQWIGNHLYYSTNGKLTTVGRHFWLYHRFDPQAVKFMVIETIPEDPRGGTWDVRILQHKILWIERLDATTPLGLNKVLSYKPFLWIVFVANSATSL